MADYEEPFERFEEISGAVRGELDAIADMIDSGISPQREDAQLLQKDLALLRTAYQEARSLTASDGASNGLMPDGLPIKSYQDEVRARRKRLLEEKLAPIEATLRKFCTITSDSPQFEDALRPFRETAAESLESLEGAMTANPVALDVDDGAYRPQEALVQALRVEDLSTTEGTQLLDEIGREFSFRVMQGVCLNQYRFSSPLAPEGRDDAARVQEPTDGSPRVQGGDKSASASREAPREDESRSDDKVLPVAKKRQSRKTRAILAKGKSHLAQTHNASTRLVFAALARLGCMSEGSLQMLISLTVKDDGVAASNRCGMAINELCGLKLVRRTTATASGAMSHAPKTYVLSDMGKALAEEETKAEATSNGRNSMWPIALADAQGRMLGCEECDDEASLLRQNEALISVLSLAATDKGKLRARDLFGAFHREGTHYVIDCLSSSGNHFMPDCVDGREEEADCAFDCVLAMSAADVPEDADAVLLAYDPADGEAETLDAERVFLLGHGRIEEFNHAPGKEPREPEGSEEDALPETGRDADTPAKGVDVVERVDAAELVAEEPPRTDIPQSEEATGDVTCRSLHDESPVAEEAALQSEQRQAHVGAEEGASRPHGTEDNEEEAERGDTTKDSSDILDEREPQEEAESDDVGAGETTDAHVEPVSVKGIAEAILGGELPFTDEVAVSLADDMMNATPAADESDEFSGVETALALLKCVCGREGFEKSTMRYLQLSLAVDSPLGHEEYTGAHLIEAFPDPDTSTQGLMLASYCHALCTPASSYDHDIKRMSQRCLDAYSELFPSYPMVKPLFVSLTQVNDVLPDGGFTGDVLREIGGDAERQRLLEEISQEAAGLCPMPRHNEMKALAPFTKSCFGRHGELYACMKIIADDRQDSAATVERVFNEYSDGGKIDAKAIDEMIDKTWAQCVTEVRGPRKLQYDARDRARDEIAKRLTVMRRWLGSLRPNVDAGKVAKIRDLKNELVDQCDEILGAYTLPSDSGGVTVRMAIIEIRSLLSGTDQRIMDFEDFLRTGYLPTGDDGLPVIEPKLCEISLCEPWRDVLRHITSEKRSLEEAARLIAEDDSRMFDNLNQLGAIGKILGTDRIILPEKGIADTAHAAADEELSQFNDKLEIAFAYNQIDEIQKEGLEACAKDTESFFYGLREYGCWREFLKNLHGQIDVFSEVHERTLEKRVESCRASLHGRESNLLDEAERLLEDDKNFTVVEEYLNRFDAGEQQISEEQIERIGEPDEFSEFMSDRVYTPIFERCRKNSNSKFSTFAVKYLKARYPEGWTEEQKKPTEEMVRNWPEQANRGNSDVAPNIRRLLLGLGLTTLKLVDKGQQPGPVFHFNAKPSPRDSKTYSHPIAAFGTQMRDRVDVLVLDGHQTPQSIIDAIGKNGLGDYSIVLVDSAISISERRQVSEIYHKRQNLPTFLLVDRVLLLYLATKDPKSRLSIMLKCTLPFTRYQPFVRDGGATADEMFCGRESELNSITDMNGATVVYGGRQLGKTALLQRAQSLCNKPDAKQYAVYVSILQCDNEESLVDRLVTAVRQCSETVAFRETNTLEDFCGQIKAMIERGTISALYLFVDEVDRYLGSISSNGYRQLQPLVDLRRESNGKFKFVLAGLHNVSRAMNATANNGIFGQLGTPLCIKPLSPTDALRLISRPLSYLGFRVDRYPHLETILTTTNYYPGILQFFGYILVDTMSSQYAKYYRAQDDNPPYELTKEQLGAIMSSTDLNNSIKEKFRLSLELDPRYFMIASCIALMYYEAEECMGVTTIAGYSPEEVKKMADGWGIKRLKDESVRSYGNLMDEMVDMYILSKPDQDVQRYRLRRHAFLSIIGKDEEAVLEGIDLADDSGE